MSAPVHGDVSLSNGRVVKHTRQANGSQLATVWDGEAALRSMTDAEWREYAGVRGFRVDK